MCSAQLSYAQDTLYLNGDDIEDPIFYSANDSIYADLKNNKIHLYGNAKVDNGTVKMDAGYITIDMDNEEIAAEYIYDADSNMIGLPHFTDGSEELIAQKVRYNFSTEKAFIEEVAITQDEIFLYMGKAKKHANNQVHFRKGRFTTCDLPDPHYHFQLSKAVMVPEKRIVSGPMNLWIKGVPTPIGLPFAIIPQVEDKTQGLIFPEITPLSAFGFGFQNLGYYIPINDKIQTTMYGTLYSRGSWGVRNSTQYVSRYKFNGNFELGYQQFRAGFPTNVIRNKATVRWTHRKDPKSNPYWNFNSNINFVSDNNTQNSLDPLNEDYFNNTLKSDVNLSRSFPGKPISMGAKLSLSQNSQTKNISLTSPIVNVNVTSFYPLKKLIKSAKKGPFREMGRRMAVVYNFKGENRALFQDTLIRDGQYGTIGSQFMNGFDQNARIQTTTGFFKNTWKLTPSITYGNKINFQQTRKSFNNDGSIQVDTIQKVGMAHTLNFNASLTTVLYSYYRFFGKNKPLLRHVLTPSFSYSFQPNLNTVISYYEPIIGGANVDTLTYSPFERSLYSISAIRPQQTFSFGFNNSFELKRKSEKDTITGFKKTRIVDALSFRGSYDFRDTLTPLSNISSNLRVSPTKWMNFVTTASFSPYGWDSTTGADTIAYAVNTDQGLGRFKSTTFATTFTLTSKQGRERLGNAIDNIGQNWNADYEYYLLHPEHFLDFDIPWKLSFSHVYTLSANTNITTDNSRRYNNIHTLMVNGDISFTKRWKLGTRTNLDLKEFNITNSLLTLTRDMHCWALSFRWTPIGTNKSFMFTMRSTSSLFQDAKIELRKPPAFL